MEKISITKSFWSPISMNQSHLENIIADIKKTYGEAPSLKFSTSDGIEMNCDSPEALFKKSNFAGNRIEKVSVELKTYSPQNENPNSQENIDIALSFERGPFLRNIHLRMSGESEGNLKNMCAKIEAEIKAMRPLYTFIFSAQNIVIRLILIYFVYTLLSVQVARVLVSLIPAETLPTLSSPEEFIILAFVIGSLPSIILLTILWIYYRTGVFRIGKAWARHQLLTKFIGALFLIVLATIVSPIIPTFFASS